MTKITIKVLIFDDFNLDHIKKHNVTKEEAVEAGKYLIYHRQTYSNRYLAIGKSGKRLITLIIKRQSKGEYYLVSARDASKKERKDVYKKEKI